MAATEVFYGIAPGFPREQLHPHAALLYNALDNFWGPLSLAVVALAVRLPLGDFGGTVARSLHVAFDGAIGLRFRSSNGFRRGDNA